GGPVISRNLVLIITQSEEGFGRVRRQFLRIVQCTFACVGASVGNAVNQRLRARKPRPTDRKVRVKLHRSFKKTRRFRLAIVSPNTGVVARLKSHAAKIGIISLRIVCWFNCQSLRLATGQLRLQRFRDSFGDLALNSEDVSQLSIKGLRPEVGIRFRVNQLHTDPHLVGRLLHATLQNIGYAKLLRDLGEIARFTLIALGGSARHHFQIGDAGQSRQDLLLDTISEVGVIWIRTEVLKWKHSNALWNYDRGFTVPD